MHIITNLTPRNQGLHDYRGDPVRDNREPTAINQRSTARINVDERICELWRGASLAVSHLPETVQISNRDRAVPSGYDAAFPQATQDAVHSRL
jgi:hypothetical protein